MSDPICPLCDEPLAPLDVPDAPPGTAPWQCQPCARGWFEAELCPTADEVRRCHYRDYGTGPAAVAILDQIQAEAADTGQVDP